MDTSMLFSLFLVAAAAVASEPTGKPRGGEDIPNPQIDMPAFLASANEAAEHRRTHRVSEDEFLSMMKEEGTVVLDARSAQKFAEDLFVKLVALGISTLQPARSSGR